MRTIVVRSDDKIIIGHKGDTGALRLAFPLIEESKKIAEGGTWTFIIHSPAGAIYSVPQEQIETDDDNVYLKISASETAEIGIGLFFVLYSMIGMESTINRYEFEVLDRPSVV